MKSHLLPLVLLAACAAGGDHAAPGPSAPAATAPPGTEVALPLPAPAELHPFLGRFVGTWDIRNEVPGGPDGPTMVMRAVETVEAVGPWIQSSIVAEGEGRYEARLALAFDPDKKAFVGTWVDTSGPAVWIQRGWIAADGRTFTAEAQGPAYDDPDRITLYQDITEFVGENRRLLRSRMKDANGEWVEFSSGFAVRR